MLINVLMHY